MLGNGICQEECYTEACYFDLGDCYCSTDCYPEDKGTCKPECMVPACGYDSFGQKGGCNDDLLLTLTYRYQFTSLDFSLPYYPGECFEICNETEFRNAYQTHQCLDSSCLIEACMNGLGGCDVVDGGEYNCLVSEEYTGECLECPEGLYLLPPVCLATLSRGVAPFGPKPQYVVFTSDTSTESSPDVLYVFQSTDIDYEGDGSFLHPYKNLMVALGAVWQSFSIINLLGDELSTYYDPKSTDPNLLGLDNKWNPLAGKTFEQIIIQSLPCDITNHPRCSSRPTTINVSNLLVLELAGNVLVQNVSFTSTGAFARAAPYTFCPFLRANGTGVIVDSNGNQATSAQKRAAAVCEKFHLLSLFVVSLGSTLMMTVNAMQDVNVTDFRVGMASFINIAGGEVKLERVRFSSVAADGSSEAAGFISQNYTCRSDFCGSFHYSHGLVEYVSNGLEYSELVILSGFLSASSLISVSISNVNFSYCLSINPSTQETTSSYALLHFRNFITLEIANCSFYSTITTGGIISIHSSADLPKSSESGVAVYYELQHITLSGLNFTSNFAGLSLVSIVFDKDVQNVVIERCEFVGNAVGSGSIIEILNSQAVTSIILSGGKKSFINDFQVLETVWFPPRFVTISDIGFFNDSSYRELVRISNFANLQLVDLRAEDCGDSVQDRAKQVFKTMASNDKSSVKKVPNSLATKNCSSSFFLEAVTNVFVQSVQILNCTCANGGVGLSFDRAIGSVYAGNWVVRGSKGQGTTGLALSFSGHLTVDLYDFTVEDCVMDGSGMIYFQDYTVVNISSSWFANNTGERGACLRADSGLYLTLWDSAFFENSSPINVGGVLAFTLYGSKPLKAEITDCVFVYNSAIEGGVLAFGGFMILELELVLLRNEFLYNYAEEKAAVLSVQVAVALTQSSRVHNCTFQGNESPYGAVSAMHYSGTLLMTSVLFLDNSGEICSCVNIESQATAQNIFRNVVFLRSLQGPAVLKTNQRIHSKVQTSNCSFKDSAMGAVTMEGGSWVDDASTYSGTTATVLSLSIGAKAVITRGSFLNNTSVGEGGVGYLGSKSLLSCKECLFRNNTARTGAVVYSEQDSAMRLEQCWAELNAATGSGSVIMLITSLNTQSFIVNSTFRHNTAGQSSLILCQNAVLTLDTVIIDGNQAAESPGVSLMLSTVTLIACEIKNQRSSTTPFLYVATNSIASIRDSSFVNGTGVTSGSISIVSSTASIVNTTFSEIAGDQSGVINAASGSNVTLNSVIMFNVASSHPGSLIFAIDSALSISDSVFAEYEQSGIAGIQLSAVRITGSTFTDGRGTAGSAVSCTQCRNVTITKSAFVHQSGSLGGAIYLDTDGTDDGGNFTIATATFSSNTALVGGAIYLLNMRLDMNKCTFIDNSATDIAGEGGALMLDCTAVKSCRSTISNTVFRANSAVLKGGAVSWILSKPVTTNVQMLNNTGQYAPDISSFPITLSLQEVTQTSGRILKMKNATEIWEVPAGQAAGVSLNVSLVDHYGHVVNIDNSSVAEITALDSSTLVTGKAKVTATNGVFLFDDIQVFATPGTAATINIHTSAIPESQAGDPDPHLPTLPLTFHLRDCLPGEYRTEQSCFVCEPGTYGFDPSLPCEKCPNNAMCLGNSTIYPSDGYWRSGIYSARIWKCPNSDACKGGEYNNIYNLTGACATGYTANMCQSCVHGFSRTTKNKCEKCPDRKDNIIRLTFIAIGAFILNIVLILSTLKSSLKPKSLHSIYLKILINYLQLVLLVADFKLEWPGPVLEVFDTQEKSGEVAEQAYSIDCILEDTNHFDIDIFFQKVIVMSILPFLIFGLAILVWGAIAIYKKKPIYLSRELTATCIISFFMIHPNLMLLLLSVFSCTEINSGEYWLTRDMQIRCWESDHLFYSLTMAVPATIVWIIAWPMLCLLFLIKNRSRHDEVDVKMQFGFLLSGYHRRHYYWEFVIMYRKFAIICCSVFLTSSVSVQALTVQLVILVFLLLQFNTLPYTEAVLNSLELRAIIVANLTIYCGLYYLTGDLSYTSSWFFFYLILLSNLLFLAYWFICFLDFVTHNLIKRIPFLARVLTPELANNDPYIEEFVEHLALKSEAAASDLAGVTMKNIYRRQLSHAFQYSWELPHAKDFMHPANIYTEMEDD